MKNHFTGRISSDDEDDDDEDGDDYQPLYHGFRRCMVHYNGGVCTEMLPLRFAEEERDVEVWCWRHRNFA